MLCQVYGSAITVNPIKNTQFSYSLPIKEFQIDKITDRTTDILT